MKGRYNIYLLIVLTLIITILLSSCDQNIVGLGDFRNLDISNILVKEEVQDNVTLQLPQNISKLSHDEILDQNGTIENDSFSDNNLSEVSNETHNRSLQAHQVVNMTFNLTANETNVTNNEQLFLEFPDKEKIVNYDDLINNSIILNAVENFNNSIADNLGDCSYPQLILNSPLNGETGVPITPTLNVTTTNHRGDNINVSFYESAPWDISIASYTGINISTQDQSFDLFFNPNGTKLYITKYGGEIYQYSLSTPWNISTRIYEHKIEAGNYLAPKGLFFKPDGTEMYEIGSQDTYVKLIVQHSLSTPWNLSTAEKINWFSGAVPSDPRDLFFNSNGSKMYIINNNEDKIYQYTLSTPWNLSTANNDKVTIPTQDNNPEGLFFNQDGTKLYELSFYGKIYQYTLLTPWDLSTANYDNVNISTITEYYPGTGYHSPIYGLFFKPNGKKFYTLSYFNSGKIYEYSLTNLLNTQTNISGGSDVTYEWNELNIGTNYEWYIKLTNKTNTNQSNTWNFTTAKLSIISPINTTYTNTNVLIKITSDQNNIWFFNGIDNETYTSSIYKTFREGSNTLTTWTNDVLGNLLSTRVSFTIDTTPPSSVTNLNNVSSTTNSILWNWTIPEDNDFNECIIYINNIWKINTSNNSYIATNLNNNTWHNITIHTKDINENINNIDIFSIAKTRQITCIDNDADGYGNNGDRSYGTINGCNYNEADCNDSNSNINPDAVEICGNGIDDDCDALIDYDDNDCPVILNNPLNNETRVSTSPTLNVTITNSNENNQNISFHESTPWDISIINYNKTKLLILDSQDSKGLFFNTNGTKLYLTGYDVESTSEAFIFQYTLSTPWDLSTATYNNIKTLPKGYNSRDLFFSPDGTKLYELGYPYYRIIYQYSLSTPWDLSTATYNEINIQTQDSWPTGLFFSPDGTKLYETGYSTDKIYQYTLSTPWDLSTATYNEINIQTSNPEDLSFNLDGTKLYELSKKAHNEFQIYQYALLIPWNLSTATYQNISIEFNNPEGLYISSFEDLFFHPNGTKLYALSATNNRIYQYSLDNLLNTQTNIPRGSDVTYEWNGLSKGTTYEWYIKLTNGTNTKQSNKWHFTTNTTDTIPPSTITNLNNISSTNNSILWNWTNPEDNDFNESIIYINNTWQTNTSNNYYNATNLNNNTPYTITIHTKDINENINNTDVNNTAKTLPNILSCTDHDNDTYAIQGGECGPIDCNDTNSNINPNATETCNNVDDDCNAEVDEDYITTPTSCGTGACHANGQIRCVAGIEVNLCTPGTPATNDPTCNNIDDDCDGSSDEDYITDESCFLPGACTSFNTGSTCTNGIETPCTTGTPTTNDNTCNNIDDDCDGTTDEDYNPTETTCGIGACYKEGLLQCINGAEVNSCTTGTPTTNDDNCNGIDDNCNGETDEDYIIDNSCFLPGACTSFNTGSTCTNGIETPCTTGTPTTNDNTCNNIDDDCDGATDEDYTPTETTCGIGACHANGQIRCVAGIEVNLCTPGTPAADETCNNIVDDDCDNYIDYADTDCAIEILDTQTNNNCTIQGDIINVQCQVNHENNDCTKVKLNNTNCEFIGWDNNRANFTCNVNMGYTSTSCSGESINALCYVDLNDCFQTGTNKSKPVYVLPNNCNKYFNQIDCNNGNCQWCNECMNNKYIGIPNGICINNTQSCDNLYHCNANKCQAQCDTNENPCSDNCNNNIFNQNNCDAFCQCETSSSTNCSKDNNCINNIWNYYTCESNQGCILNLEKNNDNDNYSINCGDCNDTNSKIYPNAAEICNGIDDNCNGNIDENLTQPTTCGTGACAGNIGEETCTAGVWEGNTCNHYVNATTETCNGIDDNCDGLLNYNNYEYIYSTGIENCSDEQDNDCDNYIDCDDTDCVGSIFCENSTPPLTNIFVNNLSTNFSNTNRSTIKNLSVGIPNIGGLSYPNSTINLTDITLEFEINISHNYININSSAIPQLNKSAEIKFYNLTFNNPQITKDGTPCKETICKIKNYTTGTLTFNVTHFTSYSAQDYCGNGYCDNEETCSSCPTDCSCPDDCDCPGGSGGSSSSGTPRPCQSNWNCTQWEPLICPLPTRIQTRNCTDQNECGTPTETPIAQRNCQYTKEQKKDELNKEDENINESIIPKQEIDKPSKIKEKTPTNTIKQYQTPITIGLIIILIIIITIFIIKKQKNNKKQEQEEQKTQTTQQETQTPTQELKKYIQNSIQQNINTNTIKTNLLKAGWNEKTINKTINETLQQKETNNNP